VADQTALRAQLISALDTAFQTFVSPLSDAGVGLELSEHLADAVLAVLPASVDQADVLDRIREVVRRLAAHAVGFQDVLDESDRGPWGKTVAADIAELRRMIDEDAPLSPFYEHPDCGFRWHGRDGMDIPMRDGQPVCPRCELAAAETRNTTEAEDPARIDRLRPEFDEHASVESIDAQTARARRQVTLWQRRVRRLEALRQRRLEQKARGEWPATVAAETQSPASRPSPTEELLVTRCDACRHALQRHFRHGACTVVLCVCSTFQYPVEELPQ
jgi:hypothetical protein